MKKLSKKDILSAILFAVIATSVGEVLSYFLLSGGKAFHSPFRICCTFIFLTVFWMIWLVSQKKRKNK